MMWKESTEVGSAQPDGIVIIGPGQVESSGTYSYKDMPFTYVRSSDQRQSISAPLVCNSFAQINFTYMNCGETPMIFVTKDCTAFFSLDVSYHPIS